MFKTLYNTFFLFAFLVQQFSFAQSFTDPSLENLPGVSWARCLSSTPDQQPNNWGVILPPSHGTNYLGIVCRIDGTNEAIGQQLSAPLLQNQAYEFSLDLAFAPMYSNARSPSILKVWGATNNCGKNELFWTSTEINHTNWQQYTVSFTPTANYDFILLEVFFTGLTFYEGSLLLDNLSAITPIVSLPITLIDFSAKWSEGYATVDLDWSTASEINNDYFTIERSTDRKNFTPILTEAGAGNSNEILSYTTVDDNPYKEVTAYYRLKQTDFDGTYAYSKTIALAPKQEDNKVNLSIYPNPTTNQLTVSIPFDKETTTDVSLSIINQQGALVQKIQYAEYNTANQTILLDNLASGVYMLRYIDGAGNQSSKTFLVHQK